MLDQDNAKLRAIAWSEVFPWLSIFRCFRIAIQARMLLLSAAGLLLMLVGWTVLGLLFSGDPRIAAEIRPYESCPWLAATSLIPDPGRGPELRGTGYAPHRNAAAAEAPILERKGPSGWGAVAGWQGPFWNAWEPLWSSWEHLSRPFYEIFDRGTTITRLAFLLLCGLWAAAVWALFGGAVTRAAAYQLATEERLGLRAAVRFGVSKWGSYFAGTAIPLLGVFLACLPAIVLGLFLRFDVGVVLAGLFWPLALVAGFLLALLVFGLLFGWPLLWPGVSAEGTDCFDAIGRAFNYTYQRPLHYLFYAAVAALFGALGWIVVSNFTAAIIGLSYWAGSWGSGLDPKTGANAMFALAAAPADLGSVRGAGGTILRFWVECLKLLGAGFLFSYFWTAATSIYFLLRKNVDGMELDEVAIDEPEEPSPAPVPEIRPNVPGAPGIEPKAEEQE